MSPVLDAMEISVRLPAGTESPARARRVVDETFGSWGCEELAEDARVVVSELVTNAVRHARTDLSLVLELSPTELRIGVADEGVDREVVVGTATQTSTSGRGLQMVEVLADRWGVEYRSEDLPGKTVWAAWELPR